MKSFFKVVLLCSVVLNLVLGFAVFSRRPERSPLTDDMGEQFAITNLARTLGSNRYLVAFQNGKYWWTIDDAFLSMNAGLNQETTLRLDKTSGRVTSTTVELTDENGRHCYFTDLNADGIPDKKRIGGDENWSVFYEGRFVPSVAKGPGRDIPHAGTNLTVVFDGTRWKAAEYPGIFAHAVRRNALSLGPAELCQ